MNMIRSMQMKSMTKTLLFDLESTLGQNSRIHCLVMRDAAGEPIVFDHQPDRAIIQGIKQLETENALIGHNIISYDIPLIQEQFPDFLPQGEVIDTLVLSACFIPILLIGIMSAPKACLSGCTDVTLDVGQTNREKSWEVYNQMVRGSLQKCKIALFRPQK